MPEVVRIERRRRVSLAANADVLLVEPVPRMVRHRYVGGNPAVELMEAAFAEQEHRRHLGRLAGERKEVQVDEPAARCLECRAESTQSLELGLPHREAVALGNRGEPPLTA